jgi:hypothetical protein
MGVDDHLSTVPPDEASRGLWAWVDRRIQHLADRQTTSPRGFALLVVGVAIFLALVSRFPGYADTNGQPPGNILTVARSVYGHAITWWLEHPFQPVPIAEFHPQAIRADGLTAGETSHLAKLGVRGTLPLLNQVLRGGLGTLLLASHVAAVWAFLLFYRIGREATGDAASAALATWAFAAAWAGQWGFQDFICGDMVAVALLLACCRSGAVTTVILLVVAGFTDERAIAAAPLVLLTRVWLAEIAAANAAPQRQRGGWFAAMPVLVSVGIYAAGRVVLAAGGHGAGDWGMVGEREILLFHLFSSFPTKIFRVWEFLWLLPVALVAMLAACDDPSRRARAGWFVLATACAVAPALLVWDVERSLTYYAPGILLAMAALPLAAATRRRLLLAIALASVGWVEFLATPLRYLIF